MRNLRKDVIEEAIGELINRLFIAPESCLVVKLDMPDSIVRHKVIQERIFDFSQIDIDFGKMDGLLFESIPDLREV